MPEEERLQTLEVRREILNPPISFPFPFSHSFSLSLSLSARFRHLQVLKQSQAEAMAQLQRLPFNVETPSMRKRQEMLEGKLREIEHALSIFMKPKVYVAEDR